MMKIAQHRGFSLTEVLLAVATLAIGMIFIGGTFFTGLHFSTLATERTIAAVVADEAFAKIRLYGVDPSDPSLATDRLTRFETLNPIAPDEFLYPSTKIVGEKQYGWSALCRPVESGSANRLVQVTVFVSRKVGSSATYPGGATRPVPVQVAIAAVGGAGNQNKLAIVTPGEQAFIDGGCTIVDNRTGQLYRVVQRDADAPDIIALDRVWQGAATDSVWVVAPPVGGGRYPCIAIYQKLISF
ncbi:MAG TPA: type II secretion system protein [Sedimentisphaerales bacterium]|nr:type II secretion system protein [Sedimentisphaerales bacterium]